MTIYSKFQTTSKNRFIAFLLFVSVSAMAQKNVGINTQSVTGYTVIGADNIDIANYRRSNAGATLVPRYSRFLSDRLMLDVNPIVFSKEAKRLNLPLPPNVPPPFGFGPPSTTTTSLGLGIGLGARYYWLKNGAIKLFTGANGNILTVQSTSHLGADSTRKSNRLVTNWGISAGANYFISPNVAIEALASYNAVYSNTVAANSQHLGFELSLRNFIGKRDTAVEKTRAQLVRQNKGSIDGSLRFVSTGTASWLTGDAKWSNTYQIRLSYAHFVLRGWLLGGSFSTMTQSFLNKTTDLDFFTQEPIDPTEDFFYKYNASVFTRYYVPFPFVKSLFVYPELRANVSSRDDITPSYAYGAGANYFLTPDVAIEATFYQNTISNRLQNLRNSGLNLGLRYFLN